MGWAIFSSGSGILGGVRFLFVGESIAVAVMNHGYADLQDKMYVDDQLEQAFSLSHSIMTLLF